MWRDWRTCPGCTGGQRGSRIPQLPELPMQSHNGHCSDNQKDPDHQRTCQTWSCGKCVFLSTQATYSQAGDIGQQILLGNFHFIHKDHASGGRPQWELSLDLRRWKALHSSLQDKTSHPPVITLSPHHRNISHGGIRDPGGGRKFNNSEQLIEWKSRIFISDF